MATPQYIEYPAAVPASRPFMWSWGGIFAGTFMFLAIESTFGILGAAIFATASNPNVAVPTAPSMSTGLQVWMIVLSIIALYFAGKSASKLLYGAADRNLGMYHGLVTFGMSVLATFMIVAAAWGVSPASSAVGTHPLTLGGTIATGGEWWLFVALILSMISAAIGGLHGVRPTTAAVVDRTVTTKRAA